MNPLRLATVVVDTGPLVAALDADEANHRWVSERLRELSPPPLTCEAVLGEASFLLARAGADRHAVVELVNRGVLTVVQLFDEEGPQIGALMRRYADRPMSVADACLVRIVEMVDGASVFTLDGNFSVYRQHRRRAIPLLTPFDGP